MSLSSVRAGMALCAFAAALGVPALAAPRVAIVPEISDIPAKFAVSDAENDYTKRVEMIPMRDGVKLYTVVVIPKGAKDAPIILTRTPYNAKKRAERNPGPQMLDLL